MKASVDLWSQTQMIIIIITMIIMILIIVITTIIINIVLGIRVLQVLHLANSFSN